MNYYYIKEIVNNKASKDAKRVNRKEAYRKLIRESKVNDTKAWGDEFGLTQGEIGVWQGVSWVKVVLLKRKPQRRGRAYWSDKALARRSDKSNV